MGAAVLIGIDLLAEAKDADLDVVVPVRPDGKISVPLLDDVQAEGLTPTELKEILTREYSEFVTAPSVTVVVKEMNSRFVSVIGGVTREGRYPLSRNMRVLEAIALAGGFNTFADTDGVRVIRRRQPRHAPRVHHLQRVRVDVHSRLGELPRHRLRVMHHHGPRST